MKQNSPLPLSHNVFIFKKKLRILIIVPPGIPLPAVTYGGIERIASSLIDSLAQKGHEIIVLGHPDSTGPFQLIPYHSSDGKYYSKSGCECLSFIRKTIQNIQPDIVQDFCNPPLTLTCPRHIPLVWNIQAFPKMRYVFPFLWRQPNTLFIGNSHHINKQIPSFLQKRTIYNSVECDKYHFTEQVSSDAPLVFLGRIEPIKGAHTAVRIAQRTGNKLVIAGNVLPQFQEYFDQSIKPYLSESISYIGPVNDAQKNELFSNAKAFIFPLHWHEPFGITVIESMACGTPVLAFPYGSMPELIQDGINGLLCDSDDDMENKIHSLSLISRRDCRRIVEEKFSPQMMAEQYLHAYYELLSERAPRTL